VFCRLFTLTVKASIIDLVMGTEDVWFVSDVVAKQLIVTKHCALAIFCYRVRAELDEP